ncbi:intradiol ring-cleavage dioxygenase [Chelatococcus asaccharovorans]|uniref:Hydroxyquinol 1,2-dioxygenase n=1 Tax=Chelatococcus asaccharovorans TaxID=28210 RepID=A0A2V3U7K1_9HYPH|nr:intradiol ring-cleavage dioxygenase [Chelatococcus asaccharovorans]MBS7706053.1 intradiol ring-cleavage dioxygenase [Chelatococcus asaccharovorans]PXW59077.1 hydroxyquinol 1,2-dioxygenase [Chelatococcus asaccharovorans]
MRDLDENTLTDETLRAVSGGSSPRVRQVSQALIRHLHAFVREVEPSQAEWEYGIDFLTRVGHMCSDVRQEFVLLSDTLGVSMLVDAINHRKPEGATETTVLGPFFVDGRPELPLGANMSDGVPGTPLFISGTVRDVAARPLAGAAVDCWHSDAEGSYDVQRSAELTMRARFRADDEGRFWFWSVRPRYYPIPNDGPVGDMLAAQGRHPFRPEHVHFMIAAPGFETLITHVFIDGDPYLDSDVVFGVKNSLVTRYRPCEAGTAPDGSVVAVPYLALDYDFVLAPGTRG